MKNTDSKILEFRLDQLQKILREVGFYVDANVTLDSENVVLNDISEIARMTPNVFIINILISTSSPICFNIKISDEQITFKEGIMEEYYAQDERCHKLYNFGRKLCYEFIENYNVLPVSDELYYEALTITINTLIFDRDHSKSLILNQLLKVIDSLETYDEKLLALLYYNLEKVGNIYNLKWYKLINPSLITFLNELTESNNYLERNNLTKNIKQAFLREGLL